MATVTEIAPDVYRICHWVPAANTQFNSFLVKDNAPLLYHTGMRSMFPEIKEAVATLIDPAQLGWIAFSHFEADECGALNEWLQAAPSAQVACGITAALVNMRDYAIRPVRGLAADQVLVTGRYSFRYRPTPHLPHGWDSGMLFEALNGTLFCSDLFHQNGDVEPVVQSGIVDRARTTLVENRGSPMMGYMPYTTRTNRMLRELATLKPRTLAVMHGSSFVGDGERALLALETMMREVLSQ